LFPLLSTGLTNYIKAYVINTSYVKVLELSSLCIFQPISSSHRPSPSPSPSMVFGNLAARQQMATPDSLQQQMYWQQMMQQQLLQQQQQLLSQHSATPQMWGQSPLALAGKFTDYPSQSVVKSVQAEGMKRFFKCMYHFFNCMF